MKLRSFIAVKIPIEVQKLITHILLPLQKELPRSLVRWVAVENIHLSLKFLGDVEVEDLKQLAHRLKDGVASIQAFTMTLSGLGVFPGLQRPRVIWLGIQSPPGLFELANQVEAALGKLGEGLDARPFSPHLTIGRVQQDIGLGEVGKIRQTLENNQIGAIGNVLVEAIHIIKSELRPTGPIYSDLHSIYLHSLEKR